MSYLKVSDLAYLSPLANMSSADRASLNDMNAIDTPVHRGLKFSFDLGFYLDTAEDFEVHDILVTQHGQPVREGVFDRGSVTVRPRGFPDRSNVTFEDAALWKTGRFKITFRYIHLVQRNKHELWPFADQVSTRITVIEKPEEEELEEGPETKRLEEPKPEAESRDVGKLEESSQSDESPTSDQEYLRAAG